MSLAIGPSEARRLCSLHAYEALGETLCDLADEDSRLAVVVSDYGRRLSLGRLRTEHPEDYVQAGIAEQGQVTIAAALALEGFRTFAPCYASFVSSRAFDQVRVCLGAMGAPVVLVGVSAGYDSGTLGATHIATSDVALMRSVAGVTVLSPGDNAELAVILRQLAADPRPAYVRVTGADGRSCLHADGLPHGLGRVERLRRGNDVAIVATGQVVGAALGAAELLAERGVDASVTEVPSVEPLDADALARAVAGAGLVVSVEEHSSRGGLGSALAELVAAAPDGRPPLLALGTPLAPPAADVRSELLRRAGLDAPGIAASVEGRLREGGTRR